VVVVVVVVVVAMPVPSARRAVATATGTLRCTFKTKRILPLNRSLLQQFYISSSTIYRHASSAPAASRSHCSRGADRSPYR
jgi:hypothetical protein